MGPNKFVAELEGIRGYAFLCVFLAHYSGSFQNQPGAGGLLRYILFVIFQLSWAAVPVFFVLSGYLITGILYDTRHRQGFLKVFYQRRAIRILPLYYALLGLLALAYWLTHSHLFPQQLLFLVYLENWSSNHELWGNALFSTGHLWSLAVEEQFYLVWPLVVLLVRDRKPLLRVAYGVIAGCFLMRVCWPLFHREIFDAYFSTPTRCDGLMLGAVLALHRRAEHFNIHRLGQIARWAAPIAAGLFYLRVFVHGNAIPDDYFDLVCMYPLVNIVALTTIVLCLVPGRVQTLCRKPWICFLGSMSYSLYLVHEVALPYVLLDWLPLLTHRLGSTIARSIVLVTMAAATYLAGRAAYLLLEAPTLKYKQKFRYGPEQRDREPSEPERFRAALEAHRATVSIQAERHAKRGKKTTPEVA